MGTAESETEVEEETEAVEVPFEVAEEAGKVANGELAKNAREEVTESDEP